MQISFFQCLSATNPEFKNAALTCIYFSVNCIWAMTSYLICIIWGLKWLQKNCRQLFLELALLKLLIPAKKPKWSWKSHETIFSYTWPRTNTPEDIYNEVYLFKICYFPIDRSHKSFCMVNFYFQPVFVWYIFHILVHILDQ